MTPSKRQSSTDDSEEDINNDEVEAQNMDIADKNYNRGSMLGHAKKSAFYGRAIRLACGAQTSFRASQELAESTVQDSKWQQQDPNKGSMMLASLGIFGKHPQNIERDVHILQKKVFQTKNIDIDVLLAPVSIEHLR